MEWLHFVLALFAFAASGGFVLWHRESAARKQAESERAILHDELGDARKDAAVAEARIDAAQKAEARLREENETLRRRETESAARIAEAEAKFKNADKTVEKLTEVRESMGAEFKNLSQKILEEKGAKFGAESEKLLAPLKADLEKFAIVQTKSTRKTRKTAPRLSNRLKTCATTPRNTANPPTIWRAR